MNGMNKSVFVCEPDGFIGTAFIISMLSDLECHISFLLLYAET